VRRRLILAACVWIGAAAAYALAMCALYLRFGEHVLAWASIGVLFAVALAHLHHLYAACDHLRALRDELDRDAEQLQHLLFLLRCVDITRPLPPLSGGCAVRPDVAAYLAGLILDMRPRAVLELGSGVSSVIIGYCLRQAGGGTLLSLDHDADYAAQTQRWLCQHGLQDIVTVYHAPLTQVPVRTGVHQWYDLRAVGPLPSLDFVFVDGPPWSTQELARLPALPLLEQHLSEAAVIVVDDYKRGDEREMVRRWLAGRDDWQVLELPTQRGMAVLSRRLQSRSARAGKAQ